MENGFDVTLITKIAFVEVMSQKDKLTENQIKITKDLIDTLVKSNVNFEFYKKYDKINCIKRSKEYGTCILY